MAIKYASLNTLQAFQQEVEDRYQKKADVLQYTIKKQQNAETGFIATYQLFSVSADATPVETPVGEKINIPKDYLVKSVELLTCSVDDTPVAGLVVGDKYIDFVINTVNTDGNASHIYLPVQDLIDIYTGGNGITVSGGNVISLNIDSQNANGLSVDQSGLKIATADSTHTGALTSTDWTKFNTAYNRGVDTATGDGNVITAIGINSTTKNITVTKGITALQASDLVEISNAEVTALWSSGGE